MAYVHIRDALEKNAEVLIMFLTYSSIGTKLLKHTRNLSGDNYSFSKVIENTIQLVEGGKLSDTQIHLVVFATGIVEKSGSYSLNIFYYSVLLPITKSNNGIELDKNQLITLCDNI